MHKRTNKFYIHHTATFWTLVIAIAAAIFIYGYFVNTTILHTAERQHVEDSIVEIRSAISQLELTLIESNRNLTHEYAYEVGFSDVDNVTFVERKESSSLSLHEI